jgi:hypothetical protein
MKRRWKDADVYLLFNEGAQASDHTVTLMSGGHRVELWDAQTTSIEPMQATRSGDHPVVRLKLAPYEARVVVVREGRRH